MRKIVIFAILLFITIFLIFYAWFIEPNLLTIEYVNINSGLLTDNADKLKILQFSDTHISKHFNEKDLSRTVKKINKEKPDIVIFTGDLIDEYNKYENKDNIHKIWLILNEIKAPLGKYAVYGNHDYGGGAEYVYTEIMENSGFKLLKNENVYFKDYNINIIGLDDSIFGKYNVNTISQMIDKNSCNIVLSHEPDVISYFLEYNVDLFLSGHSHGGQINLPFVESLPSLAQKYIRGTYNFNNYRGTILYVNIGLGTSQLPMRFMAPPELTVFILNREKQ